MNALTYLPRRRLSYFLGFAICAGLIAFALYLQFVLAEDPCPLCIFQRVAVAVMGVWFLLAALHNPRGWFTAVYSVLIGLTALTGAGIAARHVWLQHLPPDQVPSCGPGLAFMLDAFPMGKVLTMVLTGSGECAAQGWHFLGLSIPQWTLLFFIGLGTAGVAQAWNRR